MFVMRFNEDPCIGRERKQTCFQFGGNALWLQREGFQSDSVWGLENPGEEAQRAFTKERGGPCMGSKVSNRSCIITLGQDPSLPHFPHPPHPLPQSKGRGNVSGKNP